MPPSLKNKKNLIVNHKIYAHGTDDGEIMDSQSLKEFLFTQGDNLVSSSRSVHPKVIPQEIVDKSALQGANPLVFISQPHLLGSRVRAQDDVLSFTKFFS